MAIAVEPELKQLLRGCKTKPEADRVVAAYMREAKGKDSLNDRVLLSRKRAETGAKKPVRKPPEPPPPPKPATPPPKPKPKTPARPLTPPKPVKKAEPVDESDSDVSSEEEERKKSPPPKRKEPQPKISPPQRKTEKGKPEVKPTSAKPKAEAKVPAKKDLFDYYSKGTASKHSLQKSKSSLQKIPESKRPITPITPPPKRKRKKRKPKKSHDGFNDYSTSESESEEEKADMPNTSKEEVKRTSLDSKIVKTTPKPIYEESSEEKSESEEEKADMPNTSKEEVKRTSLNSKIVKTTPKPIYEESSEEESESEEEKADMPNTSKEEVTRTSLDSKIVKTTPKPIVVASSSSESDSEDDSKPVVKPVVNQGTNSDSDSDESEVSKKAAPVILAKTIDNHSDGKQTPPATKSKKILDKADVVENQTKVVEESKPVSAKKDKAVHWDAAVTSPKPTTRKSKKDKAKKAARRKAKLASLKEEEEPSEVLKEQMEPETKTEPSPSNSRANSAKSGGSSQVEHVRDDPKLAGPVYPSTLSLQSRHSQQVAEAELLPSALEQKDELQQQLEAMDNSAGDATPPNEPASPEPAAAPEPEEVAMVAAAAAVVPVTAAAPIVAAAASGRQSREPDKQEKSENRNLSPYKVLPDIPSTSNKKMDWPSLAQLQGKSKQKSEDSLIVYAKPHKKGGKKKKEKKDFTPYMEALDKACDSSLQYIVAKTGAQLGVDQPASVARARIALMMNEKKAAKLDKKIMARLQNEDGAYKKRIDKFLLQP